MTTYYLRNKWEAVRVQQQRVAGIVRYHCLGHRGSFLGVMDDFGNLV